ncbi:MAG: allophanate hydrolase [Porticoccaceae bacterium]|nr:allophanate hydrolase [Porticoccaceae bacterium]
MPKPAGPRDEVSIVTAGENAVMVYFGDRISPDVGDRVRQSASRIRSTLGDSVLELVPSYASLLVVYDPWRIGRGTLRRTLNALLADVEAGDKGSIRRLDLPVYYGEETGPDLPRVAAHGSIDTTAVIALHSNREYRVYAMGFAPGFAYMGSVPNALAAPRHASPRRQIPPGSVAIAGEQTAIYPQQSPGGWNIIGRCPVDLFHPDKSPPTLLEPGDRVIFRAISRDEFLSLGGHL